MPDGPGANSPGRCDRDKGLGVSGLKIDCDSAIDDESDIELFDDGASCPSSTSGRGDNTGCRTCGCILD